MKHYFFSILNKKITTETGIFMITLSVFQF